VPIGYLHDDRKRRGRRRSGSGWPKDAPTAARSSKQKREGSPNHGAALGSCRTTWPARPSRDAPKTPRLQGHESEPSRSAQLAFPHDPFVGFPSTLDAIAELAVAGRKLADHFVDSGGREPFGQAGNELYPLANPEFMIRHLGAPRTVPKLQSDAIILANGRLRTPGDLETADPMQSLGRSRPFKRERPAMPGVPSIANDANERSPQAWRRLPAACLPRSVTTS